MQGYLNHWFIHFMRWPHMLLELLLVGALVILFIAPSAGAAMRLQERSLYIANDEAGERSMYRLGFRFMSPTPVGSFELLFCNDPIPYHPCDIPLNMDVSGANLTDQTGETGFTISQRSTNRLLFTRTASLPGPERSTYTFDNVLNPVDTERAFSVRIKTFSSTNGSGAQVDFGSVRAQVIKGIRIETQVPPMLIYCLAQEVEYNCTGTNEVYYTDMGTLSPTETLTAQSQMAVGTNASGGFVITAVGAPLSAGTTTIASLATPSPSEPGKNQFGINLVANSTPGIGLDPEGEWANATTATDYGQPNRYKFKDGDIVAFSPNVSLMKKFTVSYIVNASPALKAGVYTTTINFIASGRF